MNYRALTAAALAALIGGSLWYYGSPDKTAEPVDKKINQPAPRETHGVGLVDIGKIQAAHPEGDNLAQLMATELRLRLELNEAMKVVALPKPQPLPSCKAAKSLSPRSIAKIPSRITLKNAIKFATCSPTKILTFSSN